MLDLLSLSIRHFVYARGDNSIQEKEFFILRTEIYFRSEYIWTVK